MSEVLRRLDDDWLDSDDEEYIDDEGALDEVTANEVDPLDLAQTEMEFDETLETSTAASLHTSTKQPSTHSPPPVESTPQATSSPMLTTPVLPFEPIEFDSFVGPVNPLGSDSTPLQYFQEIFGDKTFEYLAEQTNLYAEQNPPGDSYKWTPTCAEEMKLLIGMLLTMGIHRLPAVSDYWSTNPILGVQCISKCMSLLRFKALMRCLHLNDNSKAPRPGEDGFDKLYKIRPLFDIVQHNSLSKYKPHQENSVDEAMVLFKGRSGFKQYMPNKPVKRGYKIWMRADATNGYCCYFDVYTGATPGASEFGLGASVVKNMVQSLYGKGYYVFYDNFFSSVALAKELLDNKVYTIGTTRVNRRNWPDCLKAMKELQKSMSRGDHTSSVVEEGQVEYLVWKDNRCVPFINTICPPGQEETVQRRAKDGSRQTVKCPKSVKLYNQFMGGVDMADARRKSYSCSRKSRRWWLRLFYFLVDVSVVNSYVLAQESPLFPAMTLKDFIVSLAEELLSSYNSRKRPGRTFVTAPPSVRFCERRFPSKCDQYRNCRYCSSSTGRTRTCYTCESCNPENPVHLCPYPCFKLYHTK